MVYQSSTDLFFSLVGDRVGEIGLFNSLLLRSNPPAPLSPYFLSPGPIHPLPPLVYIFLVTSPHLFLSLFPK